MCNALELLLRVNKHRFNVRNLNYWGELCSPFPYSLAVFYETSLPLVLAMRRDVNVLTGRLMGGILLSKIIITGLGPGGRNSLPEVNLKALKEAKRLFLRTCIHPVVDWLKEQGIDFVTFDHYYEQMDSFEDVYLRIAEDIMAAAENETIVYAVPGHPLVAETTVQLIIQKAEAAGVPVQVLSAMSFMDELFSVLRIDPGQGLQIIDALVPEELHLNPLWGTLVLQVYTRLVAVNIKLALMEAYPAEHVVAVVQAAGVTELQRVEHMPLYEIDRLDWLDHLTSIYIPPGVSTWSAYSAPMSSAYPLDPLVKVMDKLRGEGGCPWDREQDHHSLTRYLIEETYEVLEAIQQENMYNICEELGDVLLQVVFHARIAKENGFFDINDVVHGIVEKMIRRHPHVFGDVDVENSSEVLANWEVIKQKEKGIAADTAKGKESVLAGVPRNLPALARAYKLQAKAARVGFDWPDYHGALDKITEELAELNVALDLGDRIDIELELGDLLFAVVNTARLAGIDPETAMLAANNKFMHRFELMEEYADNKGLALSGMTLLELDVLWEKAKKRK